MIFRPLPAPAPPGEPARRTGRAVSGPENPQAGGAAAVRIGGAMSATLIAKELAAGHGERVLFSGLDLVVAPGDVIGLVGANGAGKSTLLRLLAGLDTPEEGKLAISPPHATVGHLPQEPDRRPGESVRA